MADIKLARVDGRLIHGATMTLAIPLGADIMIAVDDEAAADAFTVKILKSSAKNVRVEVFSAQKVANLYTSGKLDKFKVMFVFKNVAMAYKAVKEGLVLKDLQLGYTIPNKETTISTSEKSVVLSPTEVEQLKELQNDHNINVYLQYTMQSVVTPFNANEFK